MRCGAAAPARKPSRGAVIRPNRRESQPQGLAFFVIAHYMELDIERIVRPCGSCSSPSITRLPSPLKLLTRPPMIWALTHPRVPLCPDLPCRHLLLFPERLDFIPLHQLSVRSSALAPHPLLHLYMLGVFRTWAWTLFCIPPLLDLILSIPIYFPRNYPHAKNF